MAKRFSTSHGLAVACTLVLAGAGCAADTAQNAAAPQSAAPVDAGPRLRKVEANGITLRLAEMGQGPLVIFLHGFPESWYSWRHQLPAIAKAGFHAVAPDVRGYGKSDKPADVEAYDIHHLTGDVVGLIDRAWRENSRRAEKLPRQNTADTMYQGSATSAGRRRLNPTHTLFIMHGWPQAMDG